MNSHVNMYMYIYIVSNNDCYNYLLVMKNIVFCDVTLWQSGRCLPVFQANVLPPSSEYISQSTSQKTAFFKVTAVRPSNLT